MSVRILSGADIARLLPMSACIDLMATALAAASRGDAVLPLRSPVRLPDHRGILGIMPAYLGEPRSLGLKAITVIPGNLGTEYESHQGAVLLFEETHGSLAAVLDASAITGIRTAAASGLATRLLAREDAGDLAILGSGVQAASHLEALGVVRTLRRVRVWSRTPEHARRSAERHSARLEVEVEACDEARDAVEGADLVCTVTGAHEPVLLGRWLAPGCHVNAVGACVAANRELDTEAVVRARLYTDCRESILHESGDFLIPRAEGAIGGDHLVGELGEVLLGQVPGRRVRDEITVFESLGIAVEDLAAAQYVLERALETGTGADVDLGGRW